MKLTRQEAREILGVEVRDADYFVAPQEPPHQPRPRAGALAPIERRLGSFWSARR